MTMKKINLKIILLLTALHSSGITASSVVYSLRIAQITKHSLLQESKDHSVTTLALPFYTYAKKYSDVTSNYAGGLASLIYNYKASYLRADFAITNINQRDHGKSIFSDTVSDDILFSFGRDFEINKKSQINISGLCGFPTHANYILAYPTFGFGQVGIGAQLDGLYHFNDHAHFIWGTRLIHFIERNAIDLYGVRHTFNIGNLADILVAAKNKWNHHGVEGGYVARWGFSPSICPALSNVLDQAKYMTNFVYLVYKYNHQSKNVLHQFLCNISYGFDSQQESFNYKSIATVWIAWSLSI